MRLILNGAVQIQFSETSYMAVPADQKSQQVIMDGLWTAEFGSSTGIFGGGAAVFREGRVMGGDSTHYYVGDYTVEQGMFRGTLKISPFIDGAQSVFNTVGRDLTLDLEGSLNSEGQLIAKGRARELPAFTFAAKLTRRA